MTTPSYGKIYISWEEIIKLIYEIAEELFPIELLEPYDTIIGMQRGGVILGTLLHSTISGYNKSPPMLSFIPPINTNDGKCGDLFYLKFCIEGKNVLLIDDVVVTGKTMKEAVDMITGLGPRKITTVCALCFDRNTIEKDLIKYTPDKIMYNIQKETMVPWRPLPSNDLPLVLDLHDERVTVFNKLDQCAKDLGYQIDREDDKIVMTKELGRNFSIIMVVLEDSASGTRCRIFNTVTLGETFSELLTQKEVEAGRRKIGYKELNDLLDALRKH